MLAPFDYVLSQLGQPVKPLFEEWRCLASSPYVDNSPGPESVSTPAKFYSYVDTAGNTVAVPINHIDDRLPPL